jgi:hypothetical protein
LDVDEVGKLLFGRPCRLALALWIVRHDKPRFYQSEPPREVILQGDLAKELTRLVRLGMLEEERRDDARRVYYDRTDSPLWNIIQAAADVLDPGDIQTESHLHIFNFLSAPRSAARLVPLRIWGRSPPSARRRSVGTPRREAC